MHIYTLRGGGPCMAAQKTRLPLISGGKKTLCDNIAVKLLFLLG